MSHAEDKDSSDVEGVDMEGGDDSNRKFEHFLEK